MDMFHCIHRTYKYIYIHIHTYMCIYMHVCMYMHECGVCLCMCVFVMLHYINFVSGPGIYYGNIDMTGAAGEDSATIDTNLIQYPSF